MNYSQIDSAPSPKTLTFPQAPNLRFWGIFLVLNGLLFLPLYLMNLQDYALLPLSPSDLNGGGRALLPLLTWRNNLDIFRLHMELTLFVTAWVLVPLLRQPRAARWFRMGFTLFFLFTLTYQVYEGAVTTLFQRQPMLYHDLRFFVDGIGFALGGLQLSLWHYVAFVAGLAFLIWSLILLARLLLDGDKVRQLSRGTHLVLISLALFSIASTLYYREALASPNMAISSISAKIAANWQASWREKNKVEAFDPLAPQAIYDYNGYHLLHKPDIYLIFVESYGSVLYKRNAYTGPYTALLASLQKDLDEAGWHTASALSVAPTWGGGSWMSYGSAQFGIEIANQPQFLALREAYQDMPYPHLGRYLQAQGYNHVRVSSMWKDLRAEEATANYNFYRPDRWLNKDDLAYTGGLYGWGPAPPDQYVLHYTREHVVAPSERPTFLFYLTQNSHYPWAPLPALVGDWQDLNEPPAEPLQALTDPIPHAIRKRNYMNAITYELRTLIDFIITEPDANTIFVLIGDHQPPAVSNRADGFDTPIHIISKDTNFINGLFEYGFKEGVYLHDLEPALHHAGFYSMFVRHLLANYGANLNALPPYLPSGIPDGTIAPDSTL